MASIARKSRLNLFARHLKERNLISLSRRGIDPDSIKCFVLAYSPALVAVQYVYDFRLDGLMVMRAKDITEVKCTGTCRFQKELLKEERLLDRVPDGFSYDLSNWHTLILQLARDYPLMILECEAQEEKDFVIGQVLEITAKEVVFRHFSGIARWLEEPTRLRLSDITACWLDSNYSNFYQRHFERQAVGGTSAKVARR